MGMACEAEGRAATVGVAPVATANVTDAVTPVAGINGNGNGESETAGAIGKVETSEEKERRLRSNSEETALILTSMMSMAGSTFPAAPTTSSHDSDDEDADGSRHSDMGEYQSGDDRDDDDMDVDDYHSGGKGKHRVSHVHFEGPTGSKLDFTDDAGFNHRFRNESNRVKSLVTKHISIGELREHFDRPIIDVAKDFGICITLMKKICRRNGIKRWPHRQIRSLTKSIASMEAAMLSAQGQERDKYRDQILSLRAKRDAVIADPNKENTMARPKTPTKEGSTRPHGHVHVAPKLSPRSAAPSSMDGVPGTTPKADTQPHSKGGRWTSEEHAAFLHGIRLYGKDWRRVAQIVRTRSAVQTRTHAQKYLLKFAGRFPFDAEGDAAMGAGDTASVSSNPRGEDLLIKVETPSEMRKSALETMAMILNSPQFGSYRGMAPSPLKIEQPLTNETPVSTVTPAAAATPQTPVIEATGAAGSADRTADDVVMESPRGVQLTAMPLLPSAVIKPTVAPSSSASQETEQPQQEPLVSESPVETAMAQ